MRAALAIVALVALTLAAASAARAQGDGHRAGVVVQYGDGSVEAACVQFAEDELSGVELLERSGLPVITQASGMGAAVCKIGPDGCDYPAEGCFCERDGARSIYWAFYTLEGGAWAYSPLGAANSSVRDGGVQGWAWGRGESGSGAQPPVRDIDAICGPATPATALAPSTPATAAPATPGPTAPAAAPATPAPTAAPGATAQQGGPAGLLGFGALALILIAGAVIAARRR